MNSNDCRCPTGCGFRPHDGQVFARRPFPQHVHHLSLYIQPAPSKQLGLKQLMAPNLHEIVDEGARVYPQKCSYCLKKVGKANLRLCSRCRYVSSCALGANTLTTISRMVRYCSLECQKAAWPTHKQRCDSAFHEFLAHN